MNRRIPNGKYGGVRGREPDAPSYSIKRRGSKGTLAPFWFRAFGRSKALMPRAQRKRENQLKLTNDLAIKKLIKN